MGPLTYFFFDFIYALFLNQASPVVVFVSFSSLLRYYFSSVVFCSSLSWSLSTLWILVLADLPLRLFSLQLWFVFWCLYIFLHYCLVFCFHGVIRSPCVPM